MNELERLEQIKNLYAYYKLFPVFPVGEDKKPLVKWSNSKNHITTLEQLEKNLNHKLYGLVTGETSNIMVVDLDNKGGKEGSKEFKNLLDTLGLSIFTMTVKTPTGGEHLYFKYKEGLKNTSDILPGVDIRTDGGYIITPYSVMKNGMYDITSFDNIEEMPGILFDNLKELCNKNGTVKRQAGRPKKENKINDILNTDFSSIAPGTRDETLFKYIVNFAEYKARTTDRETLLLVAHSKNDKMLFPLEQHEVEQKVDSAIKTILAKTNGIKYPFVDDKNKPLKIYENLIPVLEKNNIYPAYNQISNDVEILGVEPGPLTAQVEDVYSIAQKHNFNITDAQCGRFLTRISLNNSYNPVTDYLEDIYSKNPTITGAIDQLCQALISPADTDQDFKRLLITKWLVATVDIAFNDGTKNINGMLVFQGPQGLGKTRFIKWLVPNKLNKYLKTDVSLDPSNKDDKILISRYWIVELGELGVTTKKDADILKAFITSNVDEVRKPYAAAADKMPRTTSLFGTVNELEFLRDETGSRRFWVVPVEKIDWDILNNINVDDIWSEAMRLRNEGYKTYLDNKELNLLNENNQDFQVISTVEMRIQSYFDWTKDIKYWSLYSGAEIQDLLELKNNRGLFDKFKKMDNRVIKKKTSGVFKYLLPPRKYL